MMLNKRARKLTAWALLAVVSFATAGLARAGWLQDWIQGLGSSQDAGSNTQAVAAVRGLGDDDAKDTGARNFSAVDKLDKLSISGGDVDAFIREGRLAK